MGEPNTAAHVCGLVVLDGVDSVDGGYEFGYGPLLRLLEERVPLSPRYRQIRRSVPGWLADPVWVDDPRFDATYHLRRCTLPRPGGDDQLHAFTARVLSRPLDPGRPLWEMYLVEGLSGGRAALVTKAHPGLLAQADATGPAGLLLDPVVEPRRTTIPVWAPAPEPSSLELLRGAIAPLVRQPLTAVPAVGRAAASVGGVLGGVLGGVAAGLSAAMLSLARRPASSPLHAGTGEQRRVAVARSRLPDLGDVAAAFGSSVDDVALAVLSGALRGWLLSRSTSLRAGSSVRAGYRGSTVELPVGEPDPVLRLAQTRYAAGGGSAAEHAVLDLVIARGAPTSAPLFAAGARVREVFVVQPVVPGQAMSVGIASYDDTMFYALNGDQDAMRDIGLLAGLIEQAMAELVDAATSRARSRTGT